MSEKRNRRTGRWARLLGVAAIALGAQVGLQQAAHAAGYTVTNCTTAGSVGATGTLIDGLAQGANTAITFSCGALQAGGYTIPIPSTQTISASGISIDGTDNNQFDVTLQVAAGVGRGFLVSGTGSLSLSNLTLLGGSTAAPTNPSTLPPDPIDQGGVEVDGSGASFTANHVLFENLQNFTEGYGGAVYVNSPDADGGSATISNSSFVGNYATYGGAIAIGDIRAGYPGTLLISNTSFQGNSAAYEGGALLIGISSTVTLANDTIDGNQTLSTQFSRGGGYQYLTAGTLAINNTIIANNTNADATSSTANCSNAADTQGGLNLEYDAGGSTACGFGISGKDPNLSFVTPPMVTATTPGQSMNGGLVTPYWKINAIDSPAVDAVPAGTCLDAAGAALTNDQIGDPRPSGAACDIGVYELPQIARLVILCGTPQSANANTAFAQPLIVQAVSANGTPLNGQQLTYTVGSGANGASGTLSSASPPASGVATLTGTTGQVSVPSGCALDAGTTVQGAVSFTLTANGTPSIPGSSYPVTVSAVGVPAGTVTPVVFAETNLQQLADSCSLRIGFFSSLGSTNGTSSTQFSLATGKLLGGQRTQINYLALRGSAGRLLAVPVTSSVTCLLPYDFAGPPAARLPLTVDFDATVISSSVSGIAAPSTIHVTIKQDLGVSPPVQTVTITNAAQTTTYYAFTPSNYSVAPQSFRISAILYI